MPTETDISVQDEAYLATIAAEPKMTMDEVGADIDEHGHVPVTPETATQDPFTAKGSLSYALDEALSADTDLEHTTMTRDKNDHLDSHLTNPTDDFRDETKGEVEGITDTPHGLIQPIESNKVGEGLEPTIQQDKAVQVKDSLAEALDAITMDGAEEIEAKPPIGKDPEPDYSKYDEENASHIPLKAPDIPPSLGGDEDKPDSNGLVYVSATFTVDPDKYVSNNYRPTNVAKAPDAAALLKKRGAAMKSKTVNPQEEAALSDLGTPEAKESAASPDEPTDQQEKAAAREADKEQKEEQGDDSSQATKGEKSAQDEALEQVVLDYATFYDGSSFICYDEVSDIDYSKIAMDAGPKKAPTRANCQTTFAQCRAKNPLFCRFHGPKLLEADIKTAIKATVGSGCIVQVTKDKNSKNKFTFRLTVGCPPSKKKMVEKMVHMYLTQNPGITSSTEDWNLVGKHKQTQEFEMDILQADNPPKKDTKADQALADTKKAIKAHKKQEVVGETAPALEKKAAKGEKWQTVDEDVENEWADLVDKTVHKSLLGNNEEFLANFTKIANKFDAAHDAGDAAGLKQALESLKEEIGKYDENGDKKPEAATVEAEETTEETAAPEAQQEQAEEPKVEKPVKVAAMKELIANTEKGNGGPGNGEQSEDKAKLEEAFNEAIMEFPDDADGEAFSQNLELQNKFSKAFKADDIQGMKEAIDGLKKLGNGESGFTPPDPQEDPNFYEAWNDYNEPMLKEEFEEAKASVPEGIGNDKIDPLISAFEKAIKGYDYDSAKKAINGLKRIGQGGEDMSNGDGGVVLPSPTSVSKPKESEPPSQATTQAPSYSGKAHEFASKLSDLQHQFKGLVDSGADASAVDSINNLLTGAKMTYDKLAAEYDALDELDAQMKAVGEDSDLFEADKTFEQKLLEEAKGKTQGKINLLLDELESKIGGIEHTFAAVNKKGADKKKGQVADAVEEAIKNLGVYVYGGKRPPQGVDSVTDYLDYMKDEMESDGETNLSPDEMSDIEDQYHLEDAYNATKAASKAMDDAIAAFKDKMDEIPSQGEGNGTYQSDIEQLKDSILTASGELMANFASYKQALEKCKYEAMAVNKLAESKKVLAGGASSQGASSGGEVTKADIEDFFGETFDENDSGEKGSLDLWKELANNGTMYGNSPSHYFDAMGGWLQGLMKHKGADHPMTKALVKAGLNLPKGMEQSSQVGEGKKTVKPFDFDAWQKGQKAQGTQGGEGETRQDLSQKVGKPFEGLQIDIKPLISNVLSKNGMFTNFDTFDDTSSEGTSHFISMEKKQKEGYDEDYDEAEAPSAEELDKLLEQMNDEFSKYGLQVKPSTKMKNYGKNVYFEVGKKDSVEPSKKQAEPSTPAKSQMSDEEKKAKIAAMSPKQKVEAAVKIFKKKLAANPNDADAKAKLAKYEAMLAKLGK